jgi:hypothetical protein
MLVTQRERSSFFLDLRPNMPFLFNHYQLSGRASAGVRVSRRPYLQSGASSRARVSSGEEHTTTTSHINTVSLCSTPSTGLTLLLCIVQHIRPTII